jgi:hypothetical protein
MAELSDLIDEYYDQDEASVEQARKLVSLDFAPNDDFSDAFGGHKFSGCVSDVVYKLLGPCGLDGLPQAGPYRRDGPCA